MERIVETGLERFCADPPPWLAHRRIGLLCNAASVDRRFRHARDRINAACPGSLKALYSPQHGFFAEKQDNMVESDHAVDPTLKIPVFSLYGQTRQPTAEMFEPIDVLVVDLQDVGTRVYTFIYTLSYCMEAARRWGKTVLVLDRPNPVGGAVLEGNCLKDDCTSFVGRYPIPMRHGLTVAELARMFNHRFGIGCDLQVVPLRGWARAMVFEDTGLPWLAPSPNLPTPAAASVYPGQVIWEGTNVSEGRGTTQPFEQFGSPYIDPDTILASIGGGDQPGAVLRPVTFEPTANKWAGQPCRGFQIHVTDRGRYRPYLTSLMLLQAVMRHYPKDFRWKPPPYEYELDRQPIDLIIGDRNVRRRLAALEPVEAIAASWQADLEAFAAASRDYYLYE